MSNRPIAVFDSGVGSLSIIKELKAEIPTEDLIYFADRENFPYGTKSPEQLNEIMIKSIKSLEPYSPKLIIMASNTPSVQVLENIRECTSIPIMGVKPPLAEASQINKKEAYRYNGYRINTEEYSAETTNRKRGSSENICHENKCIASDPRHRRWFLFC